MKKTIHILLLTALFSVVSVQINAATVRGSEVYDLYNVEPFVNAYDNSIVNLNTGSNVSHLYAYNNSTINVNDGIISFLNLVDNSSANIYKSEVSWLNIEAGATATIFGNNFNYSRGILSGNWLDGTAFSFWALANIAPPTNVMPSNITLSSVPLPPSFFLFLSALLPLLTRIRKKL